MTDTILHPLPIVTGAHAFFRACCAEAKTGGRYSYRVAGRHWANVIGRLVPDGEYSFSEWLKQPHELETLLRGAKRNEARLWMTERFPRLLALVPPRRHDSFFEGFFEKLRKDWGIDE